MTETTYTDPTPDVRAFRDALPGRARGQLHNTGRLIVLVGRAIREHGWTVDQLVAECTRNTGAVSNVGDRIMQRLERCAESDPPLPDTSRRRIHNGCCDSGWRYDETTDPPSTTRCPGSTQEGA